MEKVEKMLEKIKRKGVLTAERPTALKANTLARYVFALPYCRGKKVLDVGAGLGFGSKYIASKGAAFVLGIDYDKSAVDEAMARNASTKIQYKHMDVLDLSEIKEKFDIVLAFEIVEHLPVKKVSGFVKLLHNLLVRKGILIMTTPNGLKTKFIFGKPYNPYHVKEYTGYEIKSILESYFKNIQIKGIRSKNKEYHKQQAKIENSRIYKIIFFLGHYRFVRELISYIPQNIKQFVTKENTLPNLDSDDFELTEKWEGCDGLFVYAETKS